jgi:hypothetical protein
MYDQDGYVPGIGYSVCSRSLYRLRGWVPLSVDVDHFAEQTQWAWSSKRYAEMVFARPKLLPWGLWSGFREPESARGPPWLRIGEARSQRSPRYVSPGPDAVLTH